MLFKSKRAVLVVSTLIILLVIALVLSQLLSKPLHTRAAPALTVKTATAIEKPTPIYLKTPGQMESAHMVNIQPQITGLIQKIAFKDGQQVKPGQLLFEIDPATYQSQLTQAQATLAKDQAQLNLYQQDEARYAQLAQENYVSQQQYDQAKANSAIQQQELEADKAAVHQAQISLSYTKIYSPIEGKIGDTNAKVGDWVTTGSQNPLVTINQLNPILVDFSLAQSHFPDIQKYQHAKTIQVEVWNETQTHLLGTGPLLFIDNQINNNTGTLLFKTQIDNHDNTFRPGQLVVVKIILTIQPNALVIPSRAIQYGQRGTFVYLIKDHKAAVQLVQVNRQIGQWTVISKGLQLGDEVITTVPPSLHEGMAVQVTHQTSTHS